MTHTITLDPETEAALERRAALRGLSLEEYVAQIATRVARLKRVKALPNAHKSLADEVAAILGSPQLDRVGTSRWSEVEAPCDAE
jgi:hypothetical protein